MSRTRLVDRRGVSLPIVLAVLLVLAILAVSFARLMSVERSAASQRSIGLQSEFAAHAGVERAIAELLDLREGDLFALDADALYAGEDADRDGEVDAGEDANLDGIFQTSDCPVDQALAPSFQDPTTGGATDPIEVWSGEVGAAGPYELRYTLRLIDAASLLDLNSRQTNLSTLLENLGRAIDPFDPPIAADQAADVVAYRDSLPDRRFSRREELLAVASIGVDDFGRIEGYLTAYGTPQGALQAERTDVEGSHDEDTIADDVSAAILERRTPVNLNSAPRAVLQAILDGLEAWYVEDQAGVLYPNTAGNPNQDPDDGSGVRISTGEALRLAEAILVERRSGPFRTWRQLFEFLDALAVGTGTFDGSAGLRRLKADLVFANLDPNTDSWRFNPNRGWASLDRREADGTHVFRTVDKFDLVGEDGRTATSTTEGSLIPSGVFEITSLGRVFRDGELVASAEIRSVVRAFRTIRLDSQADFEGTSDRLTGGEGSATYRTDVLLTGEAAKSGVQTYPEFDPRSSGTTIPQSYEDDAGVLQDASTLPALYDGQVMLGQVDVAAEDAWLHVAFDEDGNDEDDDLEAEVGESTGDFIGEVVLQRSLLAPEEDDLESDVSTIVSNSTSSIPRFERDTNLHPDGIGFVSRRHLVKGGGSLPLRGTVQFWFKPMYSTHDDGQDDFPLVDKASGDPLYGGGFGTFGYGSESPNLYVDWTLDDGCILSMWQDVSPAMGNQTVFILQRSGGGYEWHAATLDRPIERGEWVLVTGVFDAERCTLYVNDREASGLLGTPYEFTSTFTTNWGIFNTNQKPSMSHGSMDEIRAFPDARGAVDVAFDYVSGRYRSSGTWTSPHLEIPGGEDVRFFGVTWTEYLPDVLLQPDIDVSVDVGPDLGSPFVADSAVFDDPTAANAIGLEGRTIRIQATLSAGPTDVVLIESPVLDDVTLVCGPLTMEILSWDVLTR